MISKSEIIKIARLAKLKITDKEAILYQKQLSSIIDYVSKLDNIKDKKNKLINLPHLRNNVFQDEQLHYDFDIKSYFRRLKNYNNGYIRTEKVL